MGRKITTEDFITRSKSFFGNRFDYSQTIYERSSKKVTITCPEHGPFQVRASEHMAGIVLGCKPCTGSEKITLDIFIKRSNEIHNGKYDYGLIKDIASNKKVDIICPVHGVFFIRASDHYSGPKRGCSLCNKFKINKSPKKMDTKEFIIRSKEIHGDKYDYSKSEYISARDKIIITCDIHGDFEIRSSAHYGSQKQGCATCGGRGNITTSIFIAKSKDKFGGRFSYEETKYVNVRSKVKIICKQHGVFEIKPSDHLSGNGGCKECSGRPELDTNKFIAQLKEFFGQRYDYTKVEYRGAFDKVTIVCPEHGPFNKIASQVLNSKGCPECLKYNIDDFLSKANIIHSGKYDYSLVDYSSSRSYVDIVCPEHGVFSQTPNRHLDGRGCPTCGIISNLLTNRDFDDPCSIYYLKLSYKGHYFWKIGITTKDLDTRFKNLKKDNVDILESTLYATSIGLAIEIESKILQKYRKHLEYRGHILLNAKGGTECFGIDVLSNDNKALGDFFR